MRELEVCSSSFARFARFAVPKLLLQILPFRERADAPVSDAMTVKPKLVADDPWLEPHQGAIERRMERFQHELTAIQAHSKTLAAHATGHKHAGIHFHPL
jgi:hypothetical protein